MQPAQACRSLPVTGVELCGPCALTGIQRSCSARNPRPAAIGFLMNRLSPLFHDIEQMQWFAQASASYRKHFRPPSSRSKSAAAMRASRPSKTL